MRVRIVFGLSNKGASVPFHHQFLLSGMVNGLIDKYKGDYKNFELYNFSGLKGQTKVGKEGLHFYSNKVTLVLSSPNEDFIQFIIKSIFQQQQVELGKLLLIPLNVEKENAPTFTGEMKYICISPLVILSPKDETVDSKKFISPLMDIFSDLLYENTMDRMERSAKFSIEEMESFYKFQVVPDKDYLTKIREEEKKFARIFPVFDGNNKYELRGYTLPFVLYADPKVQQFVFDCGLGFYTFKGFGMLDVANADPNGRTSPYEFSME